MNLCLGNKEAPLLTIVSSVNAGENPNFIFSQVRTIRVLSLLYACICNHFTVARGQNPWKFAAEIFYLTSKLSRC
ncbi:hypothetical protein MRB53_020400 [Persea americana]|uniref:Uncharacterized protein n=1 Tax=Persea americana TaxID=3435 RepID=A0ACC2L157_PERAE|nr:hypothetical protein MRB53_020400 [Persea americana]